MKSGSSLYSSGCPTQPSSGSLVVLPSPFLYESPASWLMRASAFHDIYPEELLRFFGLKRIRDFDLDLNAHHIEVIAHGTKLNRSLTSQIVSLFQNLKNTGLADVFLAYDDEGRMRYKCCPLCLASDRVPYFRLSWRLKDTFFCDDHRCRLIVVCSSCGNSPGAYLSRRSGRRRLAPEEICRCCCICGADYACESSVVDLPDGYIEECVHTQKLILSALIQGNFSIYGHDELFPLEYLPRFMALRGWHVAQKDLGPQPRVRPMVLEFIKQGEISDQINSELSDAEYWMEKVRAPFTEQMDD